MVCRPQSKEQLIKSLCCVLIALKALHEMKIMHRDICWENVLKYIDRDRWFIIDFDDACYTTSPTPSVHLAKDSHTPEIFEDHHNKSVDIWSIGYLILTTTVNIQESVELKIYATSLMGKDKNDRSTAKEVLQWLWSEYRDVLKEDFLEGEIMEEL
ncbi:kinase-like domain-containing protein [Glomus cerebriforme]|uniref:Kinase-like domain-containing protein n=1 Tax=Glomus cerebriforme TaxID=658196 RepID=A0A397TB82_9GLOM|nr:kinase-like domain-containing protein [Glomus cerebriforme]